MTEKERINKEKAKTYKNFHELEDGRFSYKNKRTIYLHDKEGYLICKGKNVWTYYGSDGYGFETHKGTIFQFVGNMT